MKSGPNDKQDSPTMDLDFAEEPADNGLQSTPTEAGASKPSPEIQLLSFDSSAGDKWRGKKYSRGCLAVVIVLGAVFMVGLFMTAHSSLEQSVWIGFDKACERVAAGLPFEMSQLARDEVKKDLQAFAKYLQTLEDPYPTMGAFTSEVNQGFKDGILSRRDVKRIKAVIDEALNRAADTPEQVPEQPITSPTALPS